MPNDHGIADSLKELQSVAFDLLPAALISTTFPTVPVPPSLTLAAFGTRAYVRSGTDLVYVAQDPQPVTLTGADGTYWLACTEDTWTDFAQWTRVDGTHYCWRPSSTQPADVDGLLVFCQLTVAGGAITAVTPIASRSTLAAAWRGLLGLGTMAQQNANAVAITGGTAGLARAGLGDGTFADRRLHITYLRSTEHGIVFRPDADSGNYACMFMNAAQAFVGGISTSATATSYGTASDARLKHAIAPLTGSLDLLRRLNPISHRWNADDSYGENFLAHELQRVLPYAVSGQPDELNPDGSIRPQQVDASKIIPRLVGAVQELLAQVETLTTRVAALEAQPA